MPVITIPAVKISLPAELRFELTTFLFFVLFIYYVFFCFFLPSILVEDTVPSITRTSFEGQRKHRLLFIPCLRTSNADRYRRGVC